MTSLAKDFRGFCLNQQNDGNQVPLEDSLNMLDSMINELESSLMDIEDEFFNRYISDNKAKISKTNAITLS